MAAAATVEMEHVIRAHDFCARCQVQPRRPGDSYCLHCRAEYQREHRVTAASTSQTRNVKRGAELMRKAVLQAFQSVGPSEMNGRTASDIVRTLKLDV